MLLDHGIKVVDVNDPDVLIRDAVNQMNPDMVRLLLERGAPASAYALAMASKGKQNIAIVRLLLEHGARPTYEDLEFVKFLGTKTNVSPEVKAENAEIYALLANVLSGH